MSHHKGPRPRLGQKLTFVCATFCCLFIAATQDAAPSNLLSVGIIWSVTATGSLAAPCQSLLLGWNFTLCSVWVLTAGMFKLYSAPHFLLQNYPLNERRTFVLRATAARWWKSEGKCPARFLSHFCKFFAHHAPKSNRRQVRGVWRGGCPSRLQAVTASSVKPYSPRTQSLPRDHWERLRLHVCWQRAGGRWK